MSAEPVAVAEVYRAHYGGRMRNVGFNSVRLLVSGDSVAPGDKLFTRATLDAAVAAAVAQERERERERCAKLVDVPPEYEAWEVIGGQEGIDMLRELAAAIRDLKPEGQP